LNDDSKPVTTQRRLRAAFLLALFAVCPLAAETPRKVSFDVQLVQGRRTGGDTIRVQRGDEVELRWTSDRRIALHLHGYDIETTVTPGTPASMSFRAAIAGRFPVSEHRHGGRHERPLLYLEVHP
jgi:FtsP/CotA-like multicopper oxidase with cupredoxin domain